MYFNSLDFAVFLPIVFLLYWFVTNRNLKLQNFLIVVASYFFYGWWDWRFLSLILFSTLVDFFVGHGLRTEVNPFKRKVLLWTSILVNLGFLGFFKYFDFFLENFVSAFSLLGRPLEAQPLRIILPVGISFYTFQTLSYSIDVYKRKLEPTSDFIAFAAFVSFFPQLVAGPIERATRLLPQFYKKRTFDYARAVDGMRQVLWGLFKKIVIADNCAEFANHIFTNSADMSGSSLLLGVFFFSFQIYGDFSGYSDIAIGTARLFGFDLMRNFAYPYFSRDIAEFWRRWHISLSTWFRDYLYIPLGGSRGGKGMQIRNTFIIFIVSGFWHGANWTFIVWGALNALYFLPLLLAKQNRNNLDSIAEGKQLPSFRELFSMLATFGLTLLAWVFFRAESVSQALKILGEIFSHSLLSLPAVFSLKMAAVSVFLLIFILIEWRNREKPHALSFSPRLSRFYRYAFYIVLLLFIFYFRGNPQSFIYFQF
ncbi:MAG: MBOAT family protein [Bacteroidales bacterium]|nr:MBOAT family protein [Bacteroidales bacterium]